VRGGAQAAHLRDAIEQRLLDDRLVQAADLLGAVAASADVAAVRCVAEHLADGVGAEGAASGGALAVGVEPLGERAVGVQPGGVALEEAAHVGRLLGVGLGDPVGTLAVAPRQAAGEAALAGLLAQPHLDPEGERDGVVLVEDLVDRLRQERGRVVDVDAERLGDGDHVDAQLGAQQLLVALGLDRVPREARGMEDQHALEAVRHRVLDQATNQPANASWSAESGREHDRRLPRSRGSLKRRAASLTLLWVSLGTPQRGRLCGCFGTGPVSEAGAVGMLRSCREHYSG
jgi:hypothetical protein